MRIVWVLRFLDLDLGQGGGGQLDLIRALRVSWSVSSFRSLGFTTMGWIINDEK
jgi:hypothetical protein